MKIPEELENYGNSVIHVMSPSELQFFRITHGSYHLKALIVELLTVGFEYSSYRLSDQAKKKEVLLVT